MKLSNDHQIRKSTIGFDVSILVCYSSTFADAGWSSLAARRAHNPKVVGSNPAPATHE